MKSRERNGCFSWNLPSKNLNPTKTVRICSKQFLQQDFTTDASGRTWLKPGAVSKFIWPVVSFQCTSSSSIDISPKEVSVMRKGIASSLDVTGSISTQLKQSVV
ncbi:unnamed protein product [Acanthoscelides obtectus]|nr:unnamed protein product [Acanthoscelides obtectus]CAK1633589.1 hypothetical protein AOBTE_LOCUS8240 [Acanthoscelides obtectus]